MEKPLLAHCLPRYSADHSAVVAGCFGRPDEVVQRLSPDHRDPGGRPAGGSVVLASMATVTFKGGSPVVAGEGLSLIHI